MQVSEEVGTSACPQLETATDTLVIPSTHFSSRDLCPPLHSCVQGPHEPVNHSQTCVLHASLAIGRCTLPPCVHSASSTTALPDSCWHCTTRVLVPPPHSAEHCCHSSSKKLKASHACVLHGCWLGGSDAVHKKRLVTLVPPSAVHSIKRVWTPPPQLAEHALHEPSDQEHDASLHCFWVPGFVPMQFPSGTIWLSSLNLHRTSRVCTPPLQGGPQAAHFCGAHMHGGVSHCWSISRILSVHWAAPTCRFAFGTLPACIIACLDCLMCVHKEAKR